MRYIVSGYYFSPCYCRQYARERERSFKITGYRLWSVTSIAEAWHLVLLKCLPSRLTYWNSLIYHVLDTNARVSCVDGYYNEVEWTDAKSPHPLFYRPQLITDTVHVSTGWTWGKFCSGQRRSGRLSVYYGRFAYWYNQERERVNQAPLLALVKFSQSKEPDLSEAQEVSNSWTFTFQIRLNKVTVFSYARRIRRGMGNNVPLYPSPVCVLIFFADQHRQCDTDTGK